MNKWPGILKALGFTDKELSGNHGPCPICEGKDRFRFTDYKGGGEYFCSGCGPGGGFDLVMQKFDWEFGYAAKEIDKCLGTDIKQVFKPRVDIEKRRRDLNNIWQRADQNGIVREYIESRGLKYNENWGDLRGIYGLYMTGSNTTHRGMLALVRNKDGCPVSIHRTYVDLGQRKMMPPTESINGAAIRLGFPDSTLVVGEGIETTIAGMKVYDVQAGYATISAQGMETVELPDSVDLVIILADNDFSFTGQKAAFTLARRMNQLNKRVIVSCPERLGEDHNDFVLQDLNNDPDAYGLIEWDE
jgi:putative DNA primase/helicase